MGKRVDANEGLSGFARASIVYSLVPYVGVIFLPAAAIFSIVAFARDRGAAAKLLQTAIVAGVQVFLWSLLYVVPTLNREFVQ